MPRARIKKESTSQLRSTKRAAPRKKRPSIPKSQLEKRIVTGDEASQTEDHAALTDLALPLTDQSPSRNKQKRVDGQPDDEVDKLAPHRIPDTFGKRRKGRSGIGENLIPVKKMPIEHRVKGYFSSIWGTYNVLPSMVEKLKAKRGRPLPTLEPLTYTTAEGACEFTGDMIAAWKKAKVHEDKGTDDKA
ncbi:hypothetical protein DL764_009893 [Monosporascus ibericus]|uniref:Uncharacterized protein n=1 Tax=Monosporascus ibericus TaxID=155417 RepID=A0A4Q4SWM5_9PEZI|nr:hypothetical protein DL764_009893 [Monosporascus ibericus]